MESGERLAFILNGTRVEVTVKPQETLLNVLRMKFGLTGTKKGCGNGECGACTVIIDGKPVNSCLVLALTIDGSSVITIEGISQGKGLNLLQKAFRDYGAFQCGFCTPGMLLSAKALLDSIPNPTKEEIAEAISGNLCRCTGYMQIIEAIQAVTRGDYGKYSNVPIDSIVQGV